MSTAYNNNNNENSRFFRRKEETIFFCVFGGGGDDDDGSGLSSRAFACSSLVSDVALFSLLSLSLCFPCSHHHHPMWDYY